MGTILAEAAPLKWSPDAELFGVRKTTAAKQLDCSRWTIDRLIRDGELEVFQLRGESRVRVDSLRRFVERHTLGASPC